MQEKNRLLPMVQDFIHRTMPSGGYKMVSRRLVAKNIRVDNQFVLREVKTLKKDTSIPIILECCLFMKENGILLDSYCNEFLDSEIK